MLGKGVVGGGGGTKGPKPSFVSYVRPEVLLCCPDWNAVV
ncbi:MTMR12 isoform 7 [Pongo abelii]|uniref:MTMR12 isoform 7 n=1 Tax=Pongo abelii TaxID=9601 RepID=A0A2J8WAU3_PONAB|nr:MTMR12 isoform 7 [Pongo abelii]